MVGRFVPAGIALAMVPLYVRVLGTASFGHYALYASLALVVANACGAWVTQPLLRYTALRPAMEATVRWYVAQGLVTRPLPRLVAEARQAPAEPLDSLFEPPPGRERETSL